MENLKWLDIATLGCIIEFQRVNNSLPLWRQLYNYSMDTGIVNEWLKANSIDRFYARPMTKNQDIDQPIKRLRLAELLDPQSYHPTQKGMRFFYNLSENFLSWPLEIPVQSGHILWRHAVYPEFST